ncbi:MAG: CBS domain-containing protein [Myxococcota bacterium]|nr:CBS domain-containing protein [Myxococcales bacterium]
MPVGDHCTTKVATARPDATIRELASRMDAEDTGCVVIVDEQHRPIGIVTDRDIALRVLRRRRNADATLASDVMTEHPIRVRALTPIATALRRMNGEGVRRVPVIGDGGRLVGLFSIDAALRAIANEVGALASVAEAQRTASA